ncbi:THUMP domain-containing protein [Ditylenchus destructor]|uniref:THUMP domain-containing protein n=1 Tax=Ditylenchus destructor TaxID=166010 RepID=A0AAD4RAH2_9BILA|nr:THUMP domain-containing protein [Ditylenchus destructor]
MCTNCLCLAKETYRFSAILHYWPTQENSGPRFGRAAVFRNFQNMRRYQCRSAEIITTFIRGEAQLSPAGSNMEPVDFSLLSTETKNEAKNILDTFLPNVQPDNSSGDGSSSINKEEDVSDQLTKMCEASVAGNSEPVFRQFDTGVKNTLFFSSPAIRPDNMYDFVNTIVDDCQQKPHCRFAARILPIEIICAVNLPEVTQNLRKLIESHLKMEPGNGASSSYAVDFKSRHSKALQRQTVIDAVTGIMEELSPGSAVNLTKPDLVFAVNVMKNMAMLSCLRNYFERKKFSIRPPTENDEDTKEIED